MLKLFFRFGIPLGSATVLTALLELGLSSYWWLNNVGNFLYLHFLNEEEDRLLEVGYGSVVKLVIVTLRVLLTLGLWGFVFQGRRETLLAWIPLSLILDGIFIFQAFTTGIISDHVWFINIAVIVTLRLYLTFIIIEALRRLTHNARVKEERRNQSGIELEAGTPPLEEEEKGLKGFQLLEPIGESWKDVWDYYDDTPRLGAAVLILFELFWNVFVLSTHSFTEFFWGGAMFFMIKEEELFMRIWRIILDLAALFFIYKRKKTFLRFWLIIYFWTIFLSLCIFVYVVVDWFYPPVIQIVITVIMFLGDNCLRFQIVYFVLQTTTQPPAITPNSDDVSPSSEDGNQTLDDKLRRTNSLESKPEVDELKKMPKRKKTKKRYVTQKLHRLTGLGTDLEM